MNSKAQYNKNRHSIYKLQYHLVVVTKYRHKAINKEISNRLKEIANELFGKWKCEILEIECEADHLHILFESMPQIQPSKLVNNFKTVSSRLIRKEFKDHIGKYYWKPFFWSPSYCLLTTGGATVDIIKGYIQNQDKPTA
jgi:putative transposase